MHKSFILTSNCACFGTSFPSLEAALNFASVNYNNYGICQNGTIGAYVDGKYQCLLRYEF